MKSISFHRRYHGYTGGHQKVRDYIDHSLTAHGFGVSLFVDNKASTETALFSGIAGVDYQPSYAPNNADIAFLAGMDWTAYAPFFNPSQIKVNLIQHVRHGDPKHALNQFLSHKAIRLCVSDAVNEAIRHQANGPCITVKMGHVIPDVDVSPAQDNTAIDLYILANKQPKLGFELAQWAQKMGLSVLLHSQTMPKNSVLHAMTRARVTLTLPNKTEGFYLPGIEAMRLSKVAVVPDCVANREYMKKYSNSILVEYTKEAIQQGVLQGIKKSTSILLPFWRLRSAKIVEQYQISQECEKFVQVLQNIENYW